MYGNLLVNVVFISFNNALIPVSSCSSLSVVLFSCKEKKKKKQTNNNNNVMFFSAAFNHFFDYFICISLFHLSIIIGSRGGSVMRVLASHQCGPGRVCCWFSSLPRGIFHEFSRFPHSSKNKNLKFK